MVSSRAQLLSYTYENAWGIVQETCTGEKLRNSFLQKFRAIQFEYTDTRKKIYVSPDFYRPVQNLTLE